MCVSTHLPDFFTHYGEHPKVQDTFRGGWTRWWSGLEIHQQHVRKEQEEEEVHEDVA